MKRYKIYAIIIVVLLLLQLQYTTFTVTTQQSPKIYINEVELNPPGNDNSLTVKEWIELYNPNDFDVDLSGWTISTTHGVTVTITPVSYTHLTLPTN